MSSCGAMSGCELWRIQCSRSRTGGHRQQLRVLCGPPLHLPGAAVRPLPSLGACWVLRQQCAGLLTVTVSSGPASASCITELTLSTHKGRSIFSTAVIRNDASFIASSTLPDKHGLDGSILGERQQIASATIYANTRESAYSSSSTENLRSSDSRRIKHATQQNFVYINELKIRKNTNRKLESFPTFFRSLSFQENQCGAATRHTVSPTQAIRCI